MPIRTHIPLGITYNCFSPNISKIIRKNWNILSFNKSLKKFFQNKLVTAFKQNKNLKELICSNKTENNIVKKINKSTLKPGKCSPCFEIPELCAATKSQQHQLSRINRLKKTYKIFYEVNCSSGYVIYLIQCMLCKKLYVGKAETTFNI